MRPNRLPEALSIHLPPISLIRNPRPLHITKKRPQRSAVN
jgi:hypothetical protein